MNEVLEHIQPQVIVITGWNPRTSFDESALEELQVSISAHGILEPLVVRHQGHGYELVAGERRLRAAKAVGLDTVPCVVRDLDDATMKELMLLENLQREDLNPIEEAVALEELLRTTDISQTELAQRLGKSQPWISNRLRLLKAPPKLRELLIRRQISPKHVDALLSIADYPVGEQVIETVEALISKGITVSTSTIRENIRNEFCDSSAKRVLDIDNFPMKLKPYKPYFDASGCEKCNRRREVKKYGNMRESPRICFDPRCFKPRLKAAKEKAHAEWERDDRPHVDTMKDSQYTRLDHPGFDTSECEGCPDRKYALSAYSWMDGKPVCLNVKCYKRKRAEHKEKMDEIRNAPRKGAAGQVAEIAMANATPEDVLRAVRAWVSYNMEYTNRYGGPEMNPVFAVEPKLYEDAFTPLTDEQVHAIAITLMMKQVDLPESKVGKRWTSFEMGLSQVPPEIPDGIHMILAGCEMWFLDYRSAASEILDHLNDMISSREIASLESCYDDFKKRTAKVDRDGALWKFIIDLQVAWAKEILELSDEYLKEDKNDEELVEAISIVLRAMRVIAGDVTMVSPLCDEVIPVSAWETPQWEGSLAHMRLVDLMRRARARIQPDDGPSLEDVRAVVKDYLVMGRFDSDESKVFPLEVIESTGLPSSSYELVAQVLQEEEA